jgi:glycosyltransferase involved in cell wall biosynthesis
MKTDVTLAICMYNAEKYIEDTLECVLAQTMQDFELLLVDDCSTDQTVSCAQHFLDAHGRKYELHRMPQNQGIAYARNFALNQARTKYMLFVDADDFPMPELVEKEYHAINRDQELILISSWLRFVDTNRNPLRGGLFIGATQKEEFMQRAKAGKRMFFPIQAMFHRESAIRVGGFTCDGFPEGKPRYRDYCEDLDLWTRMSDLYAEGKYMLVLPEVLYLYRKADGLSSNHFNMIIKMQYVKANVRRRRAGKSDLTFIEYYNSLSKEELEKLKRDSECADLLRNGVFYLKDGKFWSGLSMVAKSICMRPSYFVDKLISNSGIIKKK